MQRKRSAKEEEEEKKLLQYKTRANYHLILFY